MSSFIQDQGFICSTSNSNDAFVVSEGTELLNISTLETTKEAFLTLFHPLDLCILKFLRCERSVVCFFGTFCCLVLFQLHM